MASVSEFNWAAYDRWLDPPSVHEEDGCARCHEYHVRYAEYEPECRACREEKKEEKPEE